MRRSFITALAATALALTIPGAALAQHAAHHSSRASSHAKRHRRHAHAVRFLAGPVAKPTTTTAVTRTPTTVTTTTTTETPGESIGTVLSFEGGVLKITLGDGSVASGKVTEATELSCPPATEGTEQAGGDESKGDDEGSQGNDEGSQGNEGDQGAPPTGTPPSSDRGTGSGPGSGHGDSMSSGISHADGTGEPACTVAALVPGAKIGEAELMFTSAGAVWEKVGITK